MEKNREVYLPQNLRWARILEDGMSQTKFGKKFNLSRSNMNSYESGVAIPPPDVMSKIAKYLDISIEQLLYHDLSKLLTKHATQSTNNKKITSMPQSEKDYQQLYYDELTKRADMQDRLLAQQDKLMQIQELFYTKYHEMKTELTHVSTVIKEVSLSSGNCLDAVVFLGASLNGFRDFSVDCFEKVLHLTPGELKDAADKAFLSSLQTNESKGTPQEQGSLSKA